MGLKTSIFMAFATCASLHLSAYEATAETTDQKIDAVGRQLSLLSASLDQQFHSLSRQSLQLDNQLAAVRALLDQQARTLEPVIQALKDLQRSIEHNTQKKNEGAAIRKEELSQIH